jgi:HK97 family phage portal protein
MSAAWFSFMGIGQNDSDVPRNLSDFARQPADEAWVYRCMSVRAENAQGIPLKVEIYGGKEWEPAEGQNDGPADDLQFLLDDVNPAWHGPQLQAYMEAGAAVHGGSYLRKVRGRFGGTPQELWWMSANDCKPDILTGAAMPTSYTYQPNGAGATVYQAKDIIPLRETVNLRNPYQMLSPLSAVRYEISVNRNAAEWTAALLKNWAIPPLVWVAPKDSSITQQDIGYIRRALRSLRGPQNQGKTPVLPGGLEPKVLSMSAKDADWLGARKISRMAVCAVLGVPLVLAGDDEKTSVYGGARDAERILWRMTLIPKLDARAATLNSWLVPDFDKTRKRLRVAYDYTGIEALQPAPAEAMAQWNETVKIGLPLNRMIAHFGMGKPVEGGDEPRILLRTGEIPLKDATDAEAIAALTGNAAAPGQGGPTSSGTTPRPAEYNTDSARSIAALGGGLYKHAAIRAFIDRNDASRLSELVPEAAVPTLIEGLRRRESAVQLARRLTEVSANE